MNVKTTILGLILIFLILNILDMITTVYAVKSGFEVNPIMAYLQSLDWSLFMAVKLLVGFVIAFAIYRLYKKHVKAARITALFIVVVYIIVAVNNAVLIASATEICDQGTFYVGGTFQKFGTSVYDANGGGSVQTYGDYSGGTVSPTAIKVKYVGERINRLVIGFNTNLGKPLQFRYYCKNSLGNWEYYWVDSVSGSVKVYDGATDVGDGWFNKYGGRLEILVTYLDETAINVNDVLEIKLYPQNVCNEGYYYQQDRIFVPLSSVTPDVDNSQISGYEIKFCKNGACTDILNDGVTCDAYGCYCQHTVDYAMIEVSSAHQVDYIYSLNGSIMHLSLTSPSGEQFIYTIKSSDEVLYKSYFAESDLDFYTGEVITAVDINDSADNYIGTINLNMSCVLSIESQGGVTFLFVDALTGALLDSVNFTLTGDDFSDSGIYNYKVTYTCDQLTQSNTYSYTASRDGYQPVSGSFTFTGGQVIKLYFVPSKENFEDEMDDPVNNTALTFTVVDSETKEPVEGATVTLESYSKLTNENGFTWFEVQKNGTYRYRVLKEGYYSISGTVNIGENQTDVTVELIPTSAIPITTPAGGGDTGGGEGGDTGTGGGLESGINELTMAAPTLIQLAILVAIVSLLGMMTRAFRRR